MALSWMTYLETGITWMDAQHKELFERINKLLEASSTGQEELISMLNFLDNYVVVHFGAEEKAMEKSQFPGKAAHVLEHNKFKEDIQKMKKEIVNGVSLISVLKMQEKAVEWLINHIGKTDRKLGEFLKGASKN